MWPRGVVVGDPVGNELAGMCQVAKQCLSQELVPHPTVEAFDEAVLHGLAGRDVVPFDLVLGAPLQDRVRGQFRPVVRDDHSGLAAAFDQRRQLPRHAAARDGRVGYRRKAFARHVIDDIQHPEAPPAGELIMHEVERPAGVGPCLDQDRGPCPDGLAALCVCGPSMSSGKRSTGPFPDPPPSSR